MQKSKLGPTMRRAVRPPPAVSLKIEFMTMYSLFGWLVADGWCWFVLREEYCWLVAGGWFVLREKYCWLVADKPSKQDGTKGNGTKL
jgi:hypothetical protein